jgi:hypothetical protein
MKYKKFSNKGVLGPWNRGTKDLKIYLRLYDIDSEENSLHYKNKRNKKKKNERKN